MGGLFTPHYNFFKATHAMTNLLEQIHDTLSAYTASQQARESAPQSFSPPDGIAVWLACLFFVLALLDKGGKLLYSIRGKPTPQELDAATAVLTSAIAEQKVKLDEHDRRLEEQHARNLERDRYDRDEHGKIYNRVNACAEGIARIEGVITKNRRAT